MAAKGRLVLLCYLVVAAARVELLWQWLLPAREKGRGQVSRSGKAQTRPCLRCCKICVLLSSRGPPSPTLPIHQFESIIE